jgi:NADPH-dependent glutamate synthase beta subunit-like oxidoreductase/NAD-dependent dihydropyrimidine dehydrogenase PreA subunit
VNPDTKSKTPPESVLILGSGFGVLKVAEDLVQSGIPVTWITRGKHFLELPGGIETFKEWPEDLNFQFRPLYLRVTRHPLATVLPQAWVESIEKTNGGYQVTVEQAPIYVDYDRCVGCSRCMEVCPLEETDRPPLTRTPAFCPSRALQLEKRQLSPCRMNCPLGVNVEAYLSLTAQGRFEEALAVIREDNPLPGVCGRVCHHPCELACRRNDLDEPLAIRDIKRFLFDHEAENGLPILEKPEKTGREPKVAVIGSGPAGLSSAHFLNRSGMDVTIFESLPQAGGMLQAGINAFRLPRKVLNSEIEALIESGITIRTNTTVDSIDALFEQGFEAVLLTTGTHTDLRLDIPGQDLDGVDYCIQFLSEVNLKGSGQVGDRTVIIGGGNSAMDAARIALRLGAKEVTILAIEKENELPASPPEVKETSEEGVEFKLGFAPVAFEGERRVQRVVYQTAHWEFPDSAPPRIVLDSENTISIDTDRVIVAIGQRPHLEASGLDTQVETGRGGRLVTDENSLTSREGVFAAGDVVSGPSTIIESMASGRKAAGRIIEHLTGQFSPEVEPSLASRGIGEHVEISEDVPRQPRKEMAERQPKARRRDFEEIGFGLTTAQAMAEAGRCLHCGYCCECRICETACADIGAIDHLRSGNRFEFSSPAVIVANEDELPEGLPDFAENFYRPESFQQATDLMDAMVAGSAAAGQAMAAAEGLRTAVVPHEPEPVTWSDTPRFGFFMCACNGTMAPPTALERILGLAASVPGIEHSQLILSACNVSGADAIAQAVRQHRLSRVIMASCVCCPLEFQCISCNDQRNRARLHLFDRLGLDRSRFEMVNLRDHLISGEPSEDEIVERATDLLRAAFIRSQFMGPLRQGETEIGRNIIILGGSEVGISCAQNLALQGFRVRLINRCRLPDADIPDEIRLRRIDLETNANITVVEEAEILDIRGHLGDYSISARVDDGRRPSRTWKADIVCLTDQNVVPLAIHEDMMGLKKFYRYDFAFFHTPQLGLYRVLPRTLNRVTAFEAGVALAAEVVTAAAEAFLKDHQLSPRVDPTRCRGCGRCVDICPFDAVKLVDDGNGLYISQVIHHNCVGCGGCVGRCPVTALDMPYFSNRLLEEIVAGTLAGEL